jgi:ATP/ADP translocase
MYKTQVVDLLFLITLGFFIKFFLLMGVILFLLKNRINLLMNDAIFLIDFSWFPSCKMHRYTCIYS